MLNYAVTHRCNSRCIMCNIWKKKSNDKELTIKEVSNFFSHPLLSDLSELQLTGGECFLRSDFVELVSAVTSARPNIKLVISSNGFLTDKIVSAVDEILEFYEPLTLAFSVDGYESGHDEVRGINGAFENVSNTLTALKNKCTVQVSFTATPTNYMDLLSVKTWAELQGFKFAFQVMNTSSGYFNNKENALLWNSKAKKEFTDTCLQIKTKSPGYFDQLWLDGIINKLSDNKKMIDCFAGYSSLYLDPYGSIYPCIVSTQPFGNIRQNSFDQIWTNQKSTRKIINRCSACWLGCEFGNNYRHNLRRFFN